MNAEPSGDDSELYAITNVEGYATEMRDAAAKSLSADYDENLEEFITIKQMINLVNKECVGRDDKDRPLLNEDANCKIYDATVTWIHNAGLAKLAAQNLIECAWDSKNNEMIFWNAEPSKTATKKRKRTSNGGNTKKRNPKKDTGT